MTPQKLVVLITTLTGGAVGLFAPVGVVKWLLQTEPRGRRYPDPVFLFGLVPARGCRPFDRPQAGMARDGG